MVLAIIAACMAAVMFALSLTDLILEKSSYDYYGNYYYYHYNVSDRVFSIKNTATSYGRPLCNRERSLYRPTDTLQLSICHFIAVFVEYLGQFLIDFNQIYRHSTVPKNTSPCIF